MDAVEKVLTNLIDSMHKHIASGFGNKKVNAAKEIKKAAEVEGKEDAKLEPAEESAFDKFLKSSVRPKKKQTEISMSTVSKAITPVTKKKK
jgi:hypothetical protein